MSNITRVIKDLIEANTLAEITASINVEPVLINEIKITNETFANISKTTIPSTGGYIKIYGKGFESNANVLIGNTESTSNTTSNTEIRINIPPISTGFYSLFVYNPSGTNAVKYRSITIQGDPNYGWHIGGQSSSTSILSSVERIQFSNDTNATDFRATLLRPTVFSCSTSTNDNMYIIGGANSSASSATTSFFNSVITRINFSNDEASPLNRASLSPSTQRWKTTTKSESFSYISGGLNTANFTTAQPANSNTDRLNFNSDTTSLVVAGNLAIPRMKFSSTNNNTFGWYFGGSSTTYWYTTDLASATIYSTIDRLNFSTDTSTFINRGPLLVGMSLTSSIGDSTYGWVSGGVSVYSYAAPNHTVTVYTRIQRMTFSSDNITAVTRATGSAEAGTSVAGNSTYAWFSGGHPGTSTETRVLSAFTTTNSRIDRFEFATDTTAQSNRSNFFESRKYHNGNSGVI